MKFPVDKIPQHINKDMFKEEDVVLTEILHTKNGMYYWIRHRNFRRGSIIRITYLGKLATFDGDHIFLCTLKKYSYSADVDQVLCKGHFKYNPNEEETNR
jgi:hypothetical protein